MLTDSAFAARGLKPTVAMEVASNESVKEAVVAKLGIAILAEHALGFAVPRQLVRLDVAGLPIPSHWHLVYPSGKQPTPVARAFLDFARHHAIEIVNAAYDHAQMPTEVGVRPCSNAVAESLSGEGPLR